MTIGLPNLSKVRKRKKQTQASLVALLDVDRSMLPRIENNERATTTEKVWKIANALGVHPGELFLPLPHEELLEIKKKMSPDQYRAWVEIGRKIIE